MRKNQKGVSIISIILIICIILVGIFIYSSIQEPQTGYYENTYEPISNSENEAIGYYYNQLSKPAKIMYETILNNKEALKIGDGKIKFTDEVEKSIEEEGGSIENNYFQTAWDAISLDNLDLFYVDTQNLSLSTKTTSILGYKSYEFILEPKEGNTYYNSSFTKKEDVENALQQVNDITDEIINNATGSTYDKVKYAHDWIVENVEYDNDNTANNDNIYGTFVNKKVVCEGYAESFKYLLDKMNIPCVLVYGEGYNNEGKREAHAWNYVKMDDGNWYAVDTTWDDPIYLGSIDKLTKPKKYEYFLRGSNSFNKNHINDGDVSGTGQDFKYPELAENDYLR